MSSKIFTPDETPYVRIIKPVGTIHPWRRNGKIYRGVGKIVASYSVKESKYVPDGIIWVVRTGRGLEKFTSSALCSISHEKFLTCRPKRGNNKSKVKEEPLEE